MRSRNIKNKFFTSEQVGDLSIPARLLFIGMWCMADFRGNLQDRPKRWVAEVFPYDSGVDTFALRDEIVAAGLVLPYSAGGVSYLNIPTFRDHQSPHHTERSKGSDIPFPEWYQPDKDDVDHGENPMPRRGKHRSSTVGARCTHGASTVDARCLSSLNPESRILNPESGILNPEVIQEHIHDRDDTQADASKARKRAPIVRDWRQGPFGLLWAQALGVYKSAASSIGGGPVARKAYDQADAPDVATLIAALEADAKRVRANAAAKRVPDTLPMLSTWLNQGRWTAHEAPTIVETCPDCRGRGYIGDPRTPESARASGFRWCGRDACREAKARAEERAADSGFDHLFALRVANG